MDSLAVAFFQEDFCCLYLAVKRATRYFCSTVHTFKLFIIQLRKKSPTMSCSHREESGMRLVARAHLVVEKFMIASMTPACTVTLFSLLKFSSVSWLFGTREAPVRQTGIPLRVLVQLDFTPDSISFMLDRLRRKNHYTAYIINIFLINFLSALLLQTYTVFLPVHFCCSYSSNFPSYFSFIHKC